MSDTYKTIRREASVELVRKRSRFIAKAVRVSDMQSVQRGVEEIKNEHPQATHHCLAYVLGARADVEFFDDDQEPYNSAGRPILGAIRSLDITNVLVVVTRYFGGKKLGVRGLIDAYRDAAEAALSQAQEVVVIPSTRLRICTGYKHVDKLQHLLGSFGAKIERQSFLQRVEIIVVLAKRDVLIFKETVAPYVENMEVLEDGENDRP